MARRYRRTTGILPRIAGSIWALGRWLIRHPQPAVAILILIGLGWGLWVYVRKAESFRIAQVTMSPDAELKLPQSILGANLWELDIDLLAQDLKRQKPWLKNVRVLRELPNRIRIEIVERKPVAQVELDRWYPVDQEGFILPDGEARPLKRLVRFFGTETPQMPLKTGKINSNERLQLAIRVLEALREDSALATHKVSSVDISDPRQINFLIDNETEVRCGSESELGAHLKRLDTALKAIARERIAVRYIDVRFKEPVISPRI